MKLTTDVALLLLLAVDNDIFIYFMPEVLTMKLTESMNIFILVKVLPVQLN